MSKIKLVQTVKLEHELLESKVATAAALLNEWIKWCGANGVKPYAIPHITAAFEIRQEDYKKEEGTS